MPAESQFSFSEGKFQSYTPVWTTDGTAPSLGNGTLTGRYARIGDIVIAHAVLIAGSTTTFGTSFWHISLPFPKASTFGSIYGCVGVAWDISATTQFTAIWRSDNYVFCLKTDTVNGSNTLVTATTPFTWADTDRLELMQIYEALV